MVAAPPPEKAPKPGLNIYGSTVVNPYKLVIAAEEIGVPYNYINLDLMAGDLVSEWYMAINPNSKVPAITHVKEDGTSLTVFESGACLQYIISEFDKEHKLSYPLTSPEHWVELSWLTWQVAGYGPMMGQACHFTRYSYEPVPYGVWRYTAEARRLNTVLEKQLSTNPYIAGDRLTTADVAVFIYAYSAKWCGIDIAQWPHVKAWCEKLTARPAFQRALKVPGPFMMADSLVELPEHQDYYKAARKFVGQGIKAASEHWKGDAAPLPSDHANYE